MTVFLMRRYVAVICFLAICKAAAYYYWLSSTVAYPYQLDYGEGIVLWQAEHVSRLASAYSPITQYPYIVFHYPPLYHAVCWAVSRFTGDLLFAGRLVSLLSTAGLCFTLAWIVYRSVPARAGKTAAIGGAVLAGALPCGLDSMQWGRLMRVDMLGLWLTFAGLALFALARTAAPRYAAFVLFVAAVYTRQTLIAAPVACLLVAAVLNIRQAIRMLSLIVALGASVMMILGLATHGQVIRHLFLYNLNQFSVRSMIDWEISMTLVTLPLVTLAMVGSFSSIIELAGVFFRHRLFHLRVRLSKSAYRRTLCTFSAYFVLSALVSLTVGKQGSSINYFLEWNLSACVLAGLVFARLIWGWTGRLTPPLSAVSYVLLVLIAAQPSFVTFAAFRSVFHTASFRQRRATEARNSEALLRIIRASPEPVMSENMTLLYRAGKQVPFEPAIVACLAAEGVWDERPLVDLIRRKAFSVMIIKNLEHSSLYSPGVARAIEESYQPLETHGAFTVYRPFL